MVLKSDILRIQTNLSLSEPVLYQDRFGLYVGVSAARKPFTMKTCSIEACPI
jgi:hypothetical protein